MKTYSKKTIIVPALGLFSSISTLLCCALPAILVTLGAGSSLASLISTAPWLVVLSKYKIWTFGISGILIMIAGIMRFIMRNAPCPIDKTQAELCTSLRQVNSWLYWISVMIWFIGFFFSFIAVRIFY